MVEPALSTAPLNEPQPLPMPRLKPMILALGNSFLPLRQRLVVAVSVAVDVGACGQPQAEFQRKELAVIDSVTQVLVDATQPADSL
ncbi:MAG: hypothetical protein U1E95_03965 [Rubrivivax sp.]